MIDVLHVRPEGDVIDHDTSTDEADCVCRPAVEPVHRDDGSYGWNIVHHSVDGREQQEA